MRTTIDRTLDAIPTSPRELLHVVVNAESAHTAVQAPAAATADIPTGAVAAPANEGKPAQVDVHGTLLRVAVVGVVGFLAYKALQNLKRLAWAAFGMAMAWRAIGGGH